MQSVGMTKLLPHAAVLDFYGREICIRSGKVRVPGGANAEAAWKDLVGASPSSPATFIPKLLAKDKGWLAAYFDVLSRASQSRQQYFTDARRLRFLYSGLRAPEASGGAIRGAFRPAPGMLLLATRLRLDESGGALIPGGIKVWQDISGTDAQRQPGPPMGKARWQAEPAGRSHSDDVRAFPRAD